MFYLQIKNRKFLNHKIIRFTFLNHKIIRSTEKLVHEENCVYKRSKKRKKTFPMNLRGGLRDTFQFGG